MTFTVEILNGFIHCLEQIECYACVYSWFILLNCWPGKYYHYGYLTTYKLVPFIIEWGLEGAKRR